VVKTTAIQHGEFWPHENKALPSGLTPKPNIEIKPGDVLMTCAGPRNRCGVACLVVNTRPKLMMSGKMYRFRPHPEALSPQFLSYFIRAHDTQQRINEMKTGINDSGLNLTHDRFGQLPVCLPPLNEQRRIVAKIEAMFEQIDKGVESLAVAKTTLGLYRQSLLKSAFEGRLTAAWRAQNPDKLEPPKALLARIQKERETRYKSALDDWQTALSEWRAGGEVGRKPSKPARPEPQTVVTPAELEQLPDLPREWMFTKLANLGDLGRGKSKHRPRNDKRLFDGRYPFIQTGEVKAANRFIREFTATYSDFGLEQSKLWPAGTLCITIAANIAQTAFLTFEACFPDSIVGFTAFSGGVSPEYVEYFIASARLNIEAYAPATAQKNINLNTLETLNIPICSPAEQAEITRILDARLTAADAMEAEINAALQRAEALRQSILKQAFAGTLVPQDPTDEPAATLLARIKAERAKAGRAKPTRKAKA
jgi:type I restriction enzyme S subunit